MAKKRPLVFDMDKFMGTAKQKTFVFKCTSCKKPFTEESTDPTHETPCPYCGNWNYSEKILEK